MSKVEQALKSAIEAMEYHTEQTRPIKKTIDTLALCKTALSEIETCEPVAETAGNSVKWLHKRLSNLPCGIKLYTSPQQKEWVGLSDEQIGDCLNEAELPTIMLNQIVQEKLGNFYKAIQAKLKQLNTKG